jgi:hypothetical protein
VRVRLTLDEEATIRAVITRRDGFRRVVRFKLAGGTSARLLLPSARRGRYRIVLRATDADGNRSDPVVIVARVRRR